MCLLLIAHQVNDEFPLIVLENRDEYYDRPTAPLDYWPEVPDLLAGKDLKSGGTWMGVGKNGRWAAVTNFREPRRSEHASKSRGWLVSGYLANSQPAEAYLGKVVTEGACYAGFNLLIGDRERLWFFSNREPEPYLLPPGIYSLSNGRLGAPWPKVQTGKERFTRLVNGGDWSVSEAFELMADTTRAPDAQLPDTGVPLDWERALSAIFIVTPTYGTRVTTLLTVEGNGDATLIERHFTSPPGEWIDTRQVCPGFA
ncbi:MAG: NRDE family protein [Desulfuromonadales bacterium]|nr:NRDE family protein [Desulfuromonadales bacterium]